ncbi:hypothetical protein VPH35_014567 [Triticum aestivum]
MVHVSWIGQALLMKATMDSIFTIAFGLDLNTLSGEAADEGSRFAAAFDDASEFILLRFVNAFWKVSRFLNVGAEAALRHRIKVVDEFAYKHIRARADEMSAGKAHDAESKCDLLSRFIQATTSDSGEVDYKYLRDIIMNIVIAGKDTTAGALARFLYMMCKHPEVQEKISEEAREAADAGEAASIDDFSQSLTDEALNKMHYLHAALTETLRLYPSVPLDNKECFSDDVLPNGFSVGKGDMVFYAPYAMGRMERLWGEDAPSLPARAVARRTRRVPARKPFQIHSFPGRSEDLPGKGVRIQADEDLRGGAAPFLRAGSARQGRQRQLQDHDHALHRAGSPSHGCGEMILQYVAAGLASRASLCRDTKGAMRLVCGRHARIIS